MALHGDPDTTDDPILEDSSYGDSTRSGYRSPSEAISIDLQQ